MSTIAIHEPCHTNVTSLRCVWEPVWRHRGVILGNLVALAIVLALAMVMVWANQTPDASAATRPGLPVGALIGRR